MAAPRLYIVSPACRVLVPYEADILREGGYGPAAYFANLALPTLAACAPAHWEIALCDERVAPVDLDFPADFVFLTCNSRQYPRMRELAREFRARGRVVVVGGPFPTLTPEAVRPFCDVLVKGELEEIAGTLFDDLRQGRAKPEYDGGWADLERSPLPRWDLYPNDRTMVAAVQTSRGCPYDCSFCEVIQVYGRKPRLKTTAQVLREVDEVYARGYRSIFLTDDNLCAIPPRAKVLLAALAEWNARRGDDPAQFFTQMTMTASKDPELLDLCARAGLVHVYIGIESPDADSLKEASKRPNLHLDITQALQAFYARGISVIGSMIVGFDADGPGVFDRFERFIGEVPLPIIQIAPLVLTRGTPLHATMQAQGRLSGEDLLVDRTWVTNLIPLQMTRAELLEGLERLSSRLYAPDAFAARLRGFLRQASVAGAGRAVYPRSPDHVPGGRSVDRDAWRAVRAALAGDPELKAVAAVVTAAERERAATAGWLFSQVFEFLQMRRVFRPAPAAGARA